MVLMDEGDGIVSWPGSLNGHVGTWGIKIHSRDLSRSPGRPVPTDYESVENRGFTRLLGNPVCQILGTRWYGSRINTRCQAPYDPRVTDLY